MSIFFLYSCMASLCEYIYIYILAFSEADLMISWSDSSKSKCQYPRCISNHWGNVGIKSISLIRSQINWIYSSMHMKNIYKCATWRCDKFNKGSDNGFSKRPYRIRAQKPYIYTAALHGLTNTINTHSNTPAQWHTPCMCPACTINDVLFISSTKRLVQFQIVGRHHTIYTCTN